MGHLSYHKKNALIHIIDPATFFIGVSLCSTDVVIPAYVSFYTTNKFLLAMLPLIVDLGTYIPQTLATYLELRKKERNPIRKYFIFEFLHRLSYIIIGVAILAFARDRLWSLIMFYLFYILSNFSWGFSIPHWNDSLSLTIPDKIRSAFIGKRDFIARIVGILSSFALPFILKLGTFPNNYGYLFLIGGFFFTIGVLPLPSLEVITPFKPKTVIKPQSFPQYFRSGLRRLFAGRVNRQFLIIFLLLTVSRITFAYFTPYTVERIISRYPAEAYDYLVGGLNTSLLIFMAIGSPLAGWVIHRFGHKVGLRLNALFLILTNLPILIFPHYAAAIVSNLFLGLFKTFTFMVTIMWIMDNTPLGQRSSRLSFFNFIAAIAILLFSLGGSAIASVWNYQGALIFSSSVALLTLILTFRQR